MYSKDILYNNFKVKLIIKEVILDFSKLNTSIANILKLEVYATLLAISFYS
jgi:hypothetical protein